MDDTQICGNTDETKQNEMQNNVPASTTHTHLTENHIKRK